MGLTNGKFNDFLGSNIGGLVTGAVAQGIGMLGEGKRYRRNLAGQKELMDIQNINQRGLNVQGHNLQYDMWKKTNYPAQVAMLKEAGLNPALMYGQAGAGGSTGSQGGGSAAGGSAPNQYQPMDMSNMLMGAQIAKLGAEKDKVEAETDELLGKNTKGKTYQEILKLQKENNILQKDINWYEKNNIAPSEYGVIKALQSTRGIWADDVKEILGMSFREKLQKLIDENLIDESEKGNLGMIYKWEKEHGRKWNGEYIPGLKETEQLLFPENN